MPKSFILSSILFAVILITSCQNNKNKNVERKTEVIKKTSGDSTQYRLLTWNIEHFVDMQDSPYIDNSRENKPEANMPERYKLLALALRKVNADIVVFQEVESAQLVKWLADSLWPDLEYMYFDDHESIDWYMNVVIMSRIPLGVFYGLGNISTEAIYVDEEGTEQREVQSFLNTRMIVSEIDLQQTPDLILAGLHLKAGGGNRNTAIRKSQISMLKIQLEKLDSQKAIVVTGDLNAYPDSEELALLKQEGGPIFIDVLPIDALSHPADSPFRRLDYILVNQAFEKNYQIDTVFIPYLFDKDQQALLSDHLPVVMDFKTKL